MSRTYLLLAFILLTADGHEDIRVTSHDFRGACSSGDGTFQGLVVGLPSSQLSKIVPGVRYTIAPVRPGTEYSWQVKAGVSLLRP